MKKLFLIIMSLALLVTGCGSDTAAADEKAAPTVEKGTNGKILVAYFSATGTTRQAAQIVAERTKGDLLEIEPVTPYTAEDLNYRDESTRATVEQKDESARPAIKNTNVDLSGYDVVFIGYPIWWGKAPRACYTFVEANSLAGKTVIPFATSLGSGLGSSADELSEAAGVSFQAGQLFHGADKGEIENWLSSINY